MYTVIIGVTLTEVEQLATDLEHGNDEPSMHVDDELILLAYPLVIIEEERVIEWVDEV
jgi:hypothetical protein